VSPPEFDLHISMSIQQIIGEAVLRRIRAKKSEIADSTVEIFPRLEHAATKQTCVRAASFSDFECIRAMNQRLGQGPDSLENWHRLWRDNPALANGNRDGVIGWVIEDRDRIVGFLGSVPLLYEYGQKSLVAAATCRFAVEPAYRALSHLLVTSFFRQGHVDLFLNTTATVPAGKIMAALKAIPLPQTDYDTVLYWILDSGRFARTVLKKMGLNPGVTVAGGALASIALRGDITIRGRKPRHRSAQTTVIEMDVVDLSEEFESFWLRKKRETHGLFAARTRAIVRWHFTAPESKRIVRVLACFVKRELRGYLVLRHETESAEGLKRTIIADLLALEDDEHVIGQLMAAAYGSARNVRSDVLEVMGFPRNVREIFLRWKPYTRRYPGWPFFYKVRDRTLQEKLREEDAWYACPYDGDSTLWP
jgi:hypothetical protein